MAAEEKQHFPDEWLDEFTAFIKAKFDDSKVIPEGTPPPPDKPEPEEPKTTPKAKKSWFANE